MEGGDANGQASTCDPKGDTFALKRRCKTAATRICLVGNVRDDLEVVDAADKFEVEVVSSEDGSEFIKDRTWDNVFVLDTFSGTIYEEVHRAEHRIVGPTALKQYAAKGVLPSNSRPVFSLSMCGTVICFTGFRKKEDMTRLMTLIHHMGGSIRKEVVTKVTHLIANCCGGDKYQYAVTFRLPVMSESWVHALWEQRHDVSTLAADHTMMSHKLKPFHGARICLYGFPDDETQHMTEVLVENGGRPGALDDPDLTHVVVDEMHVQTPPVKIQLRAHVVKSEWFWVSIQNEGCAGETDYLFEDYLESVMSPRLVSSNGTPSSSRARKRKRLREAMSRKTLNESPAVHKRRSSVSDAGLLSMSGSFLDCDTTGDKSLAADEVESAEVVRSPRQHVFCELVQTESNYVVILHTIMSMFKSQLEDMTEGESPLLNNTELKIIFGNLPPIYDIHRQMLDELRAAAKHWKEETCIGKILLKYSGDFVKAYPPFINFFETTKEELAKCDQEKPRFHAFLKICQSKPECGRQSLQELLIRPVQRLPSISLLLNDILKNTAKSNPDHCYLEQALSGIKEVMTHINEDKRKTEGQLAMFDIYHEIDNCPADLLSSQRSLIARSEVVELSDGLSGRGDHLVFFLFSDTMEVCKKRSRGHTNAKSPATSSFKQMAKPYKHVRLIPLPTIKKVIDVRETGECHNVFALTCRSNQELKEKTFSFQLIEDDLEKLPFLRVVCRQIANALCLAESDGFLTSLDANQLDINTSDVTIGTLSKAFKLASRTRMKVSRAFSINRTPNKLKRAVSTFLGSPFASTTSLTPASQLAQMRLASCSNLQELGGSPKAEGTYVAPMSVQPTRKNVSASQSLSLAALRRL